jgi:hypothetical protein
MGALDHRAPGGCNCAELELGPLAREQPGGLPYPLPNGIRYTLYTYYVNRIRASIQQRKEANYASA